MDDSAQVWNSNANATAASSPGLTNPGDESIMANWASAGLVGLVGYITLCSLLRFRHIQSLQSQLNYTDRASLSQLSVKDAQRVVRFLYNSEFPLFYDLSLRFALFKTYAMTNVARVLAAASDLNNLEKAGKRYEDTAILYTCFARFSPDTDEFLKAVARMNFLHAPYIKSMKILNKDLLYVLYASMAEPVRFLNLFEWRKLTDLEIAALGTLWKHVGDLMGIDWKAELGHDNWKDGIDFIDSVSEWASAYEDEHMQPINEVKLVGDVTMNLLLTSHPKIARPLGYQAAIVVMGDRMRHAFRYPEPSLAMTCLTYCLLSARMFALRYLCLPRFITLRTLSDTDPKTGRLHHYGYMKEPWYNPPTFWARWNPEAILTWASGGNIPGGAAQWKPEGFLFEDLGPNHTIGRGVDEVSRSAEILATKSDASTRPFGSLP